jgi:SAM-dependent methyltransferase
MSALPEGLDQRFLDFIGVTEDSERLAHHYYLQFFKPGQKVVDLGCGAGYFVKMLREQGVEAWGIDNDSIAIERAKEQDLPITHAEALGYLKKLPENDLDAVFSAHLVEHLEVETVYELIKETYRVLKPGGFLVLTTPNVHALVSHLDLFWLHFDHKRFYHPRLLEFFMKDCQFGQVICGDNVYDQKYFHVLNRITSQHQKGFDLGLAISRLQYFLLQPWQRFKKRLAQLIIPPKSVGRSFEVYVIGYKD